MTEGTSVRLEEPLSKHTAWRTGGACEVFVVVHDDEALTRVVRECRRCKWPLTLLGAGTRTVVRDGGISGVVVRLGTGFASLHARGESFEVGAAVPVPALVARALSEGRAGLEELAGVPGSLGAALALDQGAWTEAVEEVRVLHRDRIVAMSLAQAKERGRPVFVGARFRLEPDEPARIEKRMRKHGGLASSWYEAPGRRKLRPLLDNLQIPGVRLRKVQIPGLAPELLVNLGAASAADLDLLHRTVLDRVHRDRGVKLASRIRWAGRRNA